MTIKEISVEKRVQTSTQKKKDANPIAFFNTVSQSDQCYRSKVFRIIKGRYCLHFKTKTTKTICVVITNFIGLPRPFY